MSDKSSQPSIPGSPLSGIEAALLSPNTVGNLPTTVGGASSKGPEGLSKKKQNVYERLGVNHIYNMVDEKSLQAKQEVVIIEGIYFFIFLHLLTLLFVYLFLFTIKVTLAIVIDRLQHTLRR